ncbi:hypothetical protein [Paraflavitalea speifideaquila]|uniref:hypothetical protein n=1 Tax=Paraflavitalea speifideaquila TaxID=3076558 RepID=UPI0028EE5FFC|nr:hypothetical protein [Paraflavitalea speifideiaquila]
MKLTGAIRQAAKIVLNLLIEQDYLTRQIRESIAASTLAHPKVRDRVYAYLEGIERCIQAAWKWQVYTPRYKRTGSIWMETTLKNRA